MHVIDPFHSWGQKPWTPVVNILLNNANDPSDHYTKFETFLKATTVAFYKNSNPHPPSQWVIIS